jgi:flagellar motor protein MotB
MSSKIIFAAFILFGAVGFGRGWTSDPEEPSAAPYSWGAERPGLDVDIQMDPDNNFQQLVVLRPRAREKFESWKIGIFDSADRPIQIFSAGEPLPARVTWLGVGLDSRVVPDGFYHAKLELTVGGKKIESSEAEFSFMRPPEISGLGRQPLALSEDGEKIVLRLPNLVFGSGSTRLSPAAAAVLGAAADFLNSHPRSPAYVLGYTDNRGDAKTNEKVSRQRALTVTRSWSAAAYRRNACDTRAWDSRVRSAATPPRTAEPRIDGSRSG